MRVCTLHLAVAVAALVAAIGATGCSHERHAAHSRLFHCGAYHIAPDSIDMHTGVTLCAESDSAILVRVEGNTLRTVCASTPAKSRGAFAFSSGFPLFDAMLAMEQARTTTDSYNWLTPYELFLNPFVGAEGERLLFSRLRNGYIVPTETRRYFWPVINDNQQWLLAAVELFNITANRASLKTIGDVASKVMNTERSVTANPVTGLIGGIPRYMAATDAVFPAWCAPQDLMECATFSVNATRWSVLSALTSIHSAMAMRNERSHLPELPAHPDSLRRALFRNFWNPAEGFFNAMLYGYPVWQLSLAACDIIAQSVAIITGLPLPDMTSAIASSVAAPPTGVGPFSPLLSSPSSAVAPTDMLARLLWAVAMARTPNDMAYNTAVGALIYSLCNDILYSRDAAPAIRRPLSALVLRGFCGITTAFDGLRFSPSVPSGMPAEKHITGLRYRRSELSVTIIGTGNVVRSFTIDGKPAPAQFFPASAEGRHHIEIVLDGGENPSTPAVITLPPHLPAPPAVAWATPRLATLSPSAVAVSPHGASAGAETALAGEENKENFLWINGVITESVPSGRYQLFNASQTTLVQFCNVLDNRYISFSSIPHLYIPHSSLVQVPLASVVKGGTRIIEDKRLADRYVESSRYKNNRIRFSVDVPQTGRYAVDVHYIHGLGIVNSRRRTALRSMSVDGSHAGVFVFTQLSPSDWDSDPRRDWQALTRYTNPLIVNLSQGQHIFELRFFQPSPVYVDPGSNTILADAVRIYLLPD